MTRAKVGNSYIPPSKLKNINDLPRSNFRNNINRNLRNIPEHEITKLTNKYNNETIKHMNVRKEIFQTSITFIRDLDILLAWLKQLMIEYNKANDPRVDLISVYSKALRSLMKTTINFDSEIIQEKGDEAVKYIVTKYAEDLKSIYKKSILYGMSVEELMKDEFIKNESSIKPISMYTNKPFQRLLKYNLFFRDLKFTKAAKEMSENVVEPINNANIDKTFRQTVKKILMKNLNNNVAAISNHNLRTRLNQYKHFVKKFQQDINDMLGEFNTANNTSGGGSVFNNNNTFNIRSPYLKNKKKFLRSL